MQAQPNKVKLGAKDEQKYMDKLLAKARIIVDSANRLWRKFSFPIPPLLCCSQEGLYRDRDAARPLLRRVMILLG